MGMSSKGRIGESGIADFLNLWFPNADQGFGAKVIKSNGSKDIGDIDGIPYTCIEAKNYSNPPVGDLLDNAEWKAGNARRPIWFLCYKRRGYSNARAGAWHALTTVEGFYQAFIPTKDGVPMVVDQVHELCSQVWDYDNVTVGASYPGMVAPPIQWSMYMMFRRFKSPIEQGRERTLSSSPHPTVDPQSLRVPVVVHPRINEPVERWYVYSRLAGFARILETMGILPQDPEDYDDNSNDGGDQQ